MVDQDRHKRATSLAIGLGLGGLDRQTREPGPIGACGEHPLSAFAEAVHHRACAIVRYGAAIRWTSWAARAEVTKAQSKRIGPGRPSRATAPLYFSVVCSVIALVYSVGFGRSGPFSDEWLYYPRHYNLAWLTEPLNEHWLPLPKVLYAGTVHVFGMDARSSQALVVIMLGAAALLTAWELIQRDRPALSWLVPFFVFHPAQYETLLSGINLHFALCAALLITAGVLALRDRAFGPTWSLIIVALCLSGATGLLYAIPLALAGVIETKGIRRYWPWRLLATISVGAVLAWYAFGFAHQPETPAYSVSALPKGALEALGALILSPRKLGEWPAGALVGVVALFGIWLLCTSPSLSRGQKLGLLACVAAVIVEALGIGYGRGMYGPGAGTSSRFVSLITPLFVLILLIASADVRDRLRRWLVSLLAGVMLLSWPVAAYRALAVGTAQKARWQQFERDVKAGATVEQIVGRDADSIDDDDVRNVAARLTYMRSHMLGPFKHYEGELRHTTDPGTPRVLKTDTIDKTVELAPPTFLRAVRVRFRAVSQPGQRNCVWLSWNSPDAPARFAAIWTEGDGRPLEQLFWIWDDVASLSLSIEGADDPQLHVEELAVFEGDASELPQ